MNRIGRNLLLACMCCVILLSVAYANGTEMPQPLTRGIHRLDSLRGFTCDFTQTLTYADGSKRVYAGLLDVRRPGEFRWQYLQPYSQLYVSNGHGIWHYEPDLMQAEHIKSLDTIDPVAMRLLDGHIHASDIHLLNDESAGLHPTVYRYKIRISQGPVLWLGLKADGSLVYMESLDGLGNHNRITLGTFSMIAPAKEVFRFSPPSGVDIVTEGQQSPGNGAQK